MRAYLLEKGVPPRKAGDISRLPLSGYLWLDFQRDEAAGWAERVRELSGITVFDAHITDSFNPKHPSFFDQTADYEMLIFQGLGPEDDEKMIATRTAAFFLFERLIVTVRAPDNVSFQTVTRRFEREHPRSPANPAALMHRVLDTMMDRYLEVRERFTEQTNALQDRLLDPDNPFNDWRQLLEHRRSARRLGNIADDQLEAVTAWRGNTHAKLSSNLGIRYNDLVEHIGRVLSYARIQEQETESVMQLHFSMVAHRTNEVMRVLTVLSAVFLPLSLIAGIFGMNFEYMPELKVHYAYFVALAGMAILALVLLLVFRRRRWV